MNGQSSSGNSSEVKRKRAKSEDENEGFTNGSSKRKSSNNNDNEEALEHELKCTQDETRKLARIVRMLDKHGVANEGLPAQAGVSSLQAALEEGTLLSLPLDRLQSCLDLAALSFKSRLQAREAKGKGTAGKPTAQEIQRDVESFVHTITSLIEQLKTAVASRLGKRRPKRTAQLYALHRNVGNFDIFTSAASVSLEDKAFQSLEDTDVIAIHTAEAGPSTSSSSRLKDISQPFEHEIKPLTDLTPRIEPVTFLYYHPYASYAPTYDSSTATLSLAQSLHLRASQTALKELESRSLPPLPPLPPSGHVRKALDPALLSSSIGVDEEELRQAIRNIEDVEQIDTRIRENTELLRILQEAQYDRLRKVSLSHKQDKDSKPADLAVSGASEIENHAAQRLLESLQSIANARPRSYNSTSTPAGPSIQDQIQGFVNRDPAHWRRVRAQLIQRKQIPYRGTLEEGGQKAIRESHGQRGCKG